MLNSLFRRKPNPVRDQARRSIARWTRDALGLDADDGVSVNEIDCADLRCPGTETFVFVMRRGKRTECFKISAAADQVTEADLKSAAAAHLEQSGT